MSRNTRDIALLAAGAALAPRSQTVYNRTEVVERRAPTDESVKLLKEMEEKAEAKLIATLPLKNNLFEGTVVIDHYLADMTIRARLVFVLNGKQIVVTESAYEGDGARVELMQKLHDATAKKIAAEILLDSVSALRF